jgi:hypothetical protein
VRVPTAVVTAGQLMKDIPELAEGFRLGDRQEGSAPSHEGSISDDVTLYPPGVPLVLADGSTAWLDTTPRLLRHMPHDETARVGFACMYYDVPSCEEHRCYTWLPRPGTTQEVLGSSPGWGEPSTEIDAHAAPLHRPVFVKRLDLGCGAQVDGGLLVSHLASAVDPPRRLVSLLDAQGAVRWTVPLAAVDRADPMPVGVVLDEAGAIHLVVGDRFGEGVDRRHLSSRGLDLIHLSPRGDLLGVQRLF